MFVVSCKLFKLIISLVLVLVILSAEDITAENVFLHKNSNMINMANRQFDFHKLAKRRDLDPQTCVDNFDIHRDKIIRTEDSREMGAKYLNEIDLGSRDECLRLCCETESCDVFVFEEKSPGSCYLFHCGPPEDFKCKFTRHTNFSSAVLAVNRHLAELEDQIKLTKHEQDLASLRKQVQDASSTTRPITIRPFIARLETAPPITVSRRCSRFQFECHSSEECIAIYNACDGIPQCTDGSDEAPELGCPALTTLPPPPNLPPREIMPQIPQLPQIPQYNTNEQLPKELPVQHPPAFMRPMGSPEGPPWPRRLDQSSMSNPIPHIKQYNENIGASHIFNHKGGLQVTETDSVAAGQYEYKALPYDALPENGWPHRPWPQQQADQTNSNDGAPLYRVDIEPQASWKQQQPPVQNTPMQQRMQNLENQLPLQRMQPDKLQVLPNMFQDREKMWAVPQMQNIQHDVQPMYTQTKTMPSMEAGFTKTKLEKQHQPPVSEKNLNDSDSDTDEETDDSSDDNTEVQQNEKTDDASQKNKSKDRSNKKHSANKIKKKHLKADHEQNGEEENTDKEVIEKIKVPMPHESLMGKPFDDDVHDGAAERPPGAILLLTVGVCMTSIMVVLLGCRLKMARRRMRRSGKSPFAHDADYLVNGMYL